MNRFWGNTSGMALGTLLSRVTGIGRDIALVAGIGTGVFADTYSVANSIPNIMYILVAGGAINAVFVPALVRHMREDDDDGKAFTDRLLTLVGVVLFALVVVIMIAAQQVVGLYATAEWTVSDMRVATVFTLWCIPQVVFYGLYTLYAQVLNARDVFVVPMFAPVLNNVVVIVTAALFLTVMQGGSTTSTVTMGGLALLGAGTTLGVVVQALALIPAAAKAGYRFRPRLDWRGTGLGKVGDLAVWTTGFVLVNQLSFLVISNLTTFANVVAGDRGEVAAGFTSYQKAQLMMMLPHSVITVSVITALLPRLSRTAHAGDLPAYGADLAESLRVVLALIVPCAALLVVTGPDLGQLLYGYGASTPQQGVAVGQICAMFALGLPAFSVFYVLLRSYYAREDTRTPFLVNLGFNLLHLGIGVAAFSVVPSRYQVASLALAYSVAYTVTAAATWRAVARHTPEVSVGMTRHVTRVTSATAVAAVAAVAVHITLPDLLGSSSPATVVADVSLTSLAFLTVYVSLGLALQIVRPEQLRAFRRRRLDS